MKKILFAFLTYIVTVVTVQAEPNPVSIARDYYKIVGAKYMFLAYKESECGGFVKDHIKDIETGLEGITKEIRILLNKEQNKIAKEMLGENDKTVKYESYQWLNKKFETLKEQYKSKGFACGLTLGVTLPILEEVQHRRINILNRLNGK